MENVEGLVNHDKVNPKDKIGRTLDTILKHLDALGYHVTWKVLNAKNYGVPQERKRIYIVGTKQSLPSLENLSESLTTLGDILETGLPPHKSHFTDLILQHYSLDELYGKSIKDKRGGKNNIHSWDIEYKGAISLEQRNLLNQILHERRKKKWAEEFGVEWMDGMPLTFAQIQTFNDSPDLEEMLTDLVKKKYIKLEHPKRKVGNQRVQDSNLPLGYNIVSGKMSFEVNEILDPKGVAPTLVAMDMQHLFVVDGEGIRTLSLREGLRLFGYPDDFKFNIDKNLGYDLLGNTVVVPVISLVANQIIKLFAEVER